MSSGMRDLTTQCEWDGDSESCTGWASVVVWDGVDCEWNLCRTHGEAKLHLIREAEQKYKQSQRDDARKVYEARLAEIDRED